MDDDAISYIGVRSTSAELNVKFGIRQTDRRNHLYIVGKTGSGKTTLLRNFIVQDFQAGRGVAVLDPHGDLSRDLLELVPPERMRHVVYFSPSDLAHPIGFNLLAHVPPDERDLVASNVVGTFKHLWRDSWGPRMEYIFKNTVSALLDCPADTTLLGVPRMLTDERYRNRIARHIQNPKVRTFWENEFGDWNDRQRSEYTAPILNKVGMFLTSDALRNILGQARSTVDLGFMMDNRRIFIANLSKGELGEDNANLIGSLLVTGFGLAAMKRARQSEDNRTDFHLVIDEFHNFTTESFASILSEARKYRLNLSLAHQYIEQLTPSIRAAVFGNCGSLISFRVGAADALVLAPEFDPKPPVVLTDLARREVCARLLEEGEVGNPFIGKTLPPLGDRHGRSEKLITYSRKRYTRPREDVEAAHLRWLNPPAQRRRSRGGRKK